MFAAVRNGLAFIVSDMCYLQSGNLKNKQKTPLPICRKELLDQLVLNSGFDVKTFIGILVSILMYICRYGILLHNTLNKRRSYICMYVHESIMCFLM
jgi:hypothetical protein